MANAFFEQSGARPRPNSLPAVAVIGAGVSGLLAARTLTDHGLAVTVFDKGRGPGGRMAARLITDSGTSSAKTRD